MGYTHGAAEDGRVDWDIDEWMVEKEGGEEGCLSSEGIEGQVRRAVELGDWENNRICRATTRIHSALIRKSVFRVCLCSTKLH